MGHLCHVGGVTSRGRASSRYARRRARQSVSVHRRAQWQHIGQQPIARVDILAAGTPLLRHRPEAFHRARKTEERPDGTHTAREKIRASSPRLPMRPPRIRTGRRRFLTSMRGFRTCSPRLAMWSVRRPTRSPPFYSLSGSPRAGGCGRSGRRVTAARDGTATAQRRHAYTSAFVPAPGAPLGPREMSREPAYQTCCSLFQRAAPPPAAGLWT